MIVECVEVVYLIYQLTTKQQKMNYELKVTEINTKGAKFLYEVIDEVGNIISQRKSNREYVACTIKGSFYWGRLDLIGKGDYKKILDWAQQRSVATKFPENYYSEQTLEEYNKEGLEDFNNLSNIAYKK